jgi:hypothetical protein
VKLVAKRIGPPLNTNNRRRNTALMMTQSENLNSSSNRCFLSLESTLKICHINIEGIFISKSEYLAHLMHDEDIDIVAVQETHAESEENLRRRGTIPGYSLIGAVYSNVHGIATYVKASFSKFRALYKDHSHNVHTLAVKVDRTIVVNVYQPPSSSWSNVPHKLFPHPAIYVDDFNSHNQLWGFDADGNRFPVNKLQLIYHPKDKGTFKSVREKITRLIYQL